MATLGVPSPFFTFKGPAGFPSPAADHIERRMSLDELLNVKAPHIYLVRIEGESMTGAGIFDGDLVLWDRSLTPVNSQIVIAAINGEPVCKRLVTRSQQVILVPENPRYPARYILDGEDVAIRGVATYSGRCHEHKA